MTATGTAAGVALDQFGGTGQLVDDAQLLHAELVAVGVDLADVAVDRGDAGDADRDIGLALAPRTPERVADDHGDVHDRGLSEARRMPAGRGIGVLGQQHDAAVRPRWSTGRRRCWHTRSRGASR